MTLMLQRAPRPSSGSRSSRPADHDRVGRPAPAAGGLASDSPCAQVVVDVRRGRQGPVLIVSGELDISSAPLLRAMLDHLDSQGRAVQVEVDLRAVSFADSHGLQPLLDRRVTVRSVSPAIGRVLLLLSGQSKLAGPLPSSAARPGGGEQLARPATTQGPGSQALHVTAAGRSRPQEHPEHQPSVPRAVRRPGQPS